MRMVRKSGDVLVWVIAAKVVQQQKRVQIAQRRRADAGVNRDARAFGYFKGGNVLTDSACCHA